MLLPSLWSTEERPNKSDQLWRERGIPMVLFLPSSAALLFLGDVLCKSTGSMFGQSLSGSSPGPKHPGKALFAHIYLACPVDIKEKLTERRSSFTREQVQISARTTVFAGLCYLGMKQTHFPSGEMPALIPASSPAQVGWMQWDGHRSGETTMSSKGQWGSLYFKGQGLRVVLLATPSPPPARLRAFSTSSGNETKT